MKTSVMPRGAVSGPMTSTMPAKDLESASLATEPRALKSGSRNLPIDTLRGFACLLLATYHVIGHDAGAGLRVPHGDPLRVFNELLVFARMPLFAFLSGFVYAWRPYKGNAVEFVGAKIRRLLIPMLLVGTAYAFIQISTPGVNTTEVIHWKLLHVVPVSHYWFLESLFFVFLGIMLVETLGLMSTEAGFLAVFAGGVALHLLHPLPIYFGLQGSGYLLPYFLLGIWANRFEGNQRHPWVVPALLASSAAAITYLKVAKQPMPAPFSGYELLFGATICISLLRLNLRVSWLAWIGYYSFTIYLFHSMFSAATRLALQKVWAAPVWFLLLAGVVAAILGPILIQPWIERIPVVGTWILGEKSKRSAAS
jgi:fucose 4-O-acetylase-like acetyltransferase